MRKRTQKYVYAIQTEDAESLDILIFSTMKGVLKQAEEWFDWMGMNSEEIDGEIIAFEAGLTKSNKFVEAHGIIARRLELEN